MRFQRCRVVIERQQVEADVILSRPHAGKVKRLTAMEDEGSFQVVVTGLVCLHLDFAKERIKYLAQRREDHGKVRLYGFIDGRRQFPSRLRGWHDRSSIADLWMD